jgi:hypothetical protein
MEKVNLRHDDDELVHFMVREGICLSREPYLDLAFGRNRPEVISSEEEAMLPSRFRARNDRRRSHRTANGLEALGPDNWFNYCAIFDHHGLEQTSRIENMYCSRSLLAQADEHWLGYQRVRSVTSNWEAF